MKEENEETSRETGSLLEKAAWPGISHSPEQEFREPRLGRMCAVCFHLVPGGALMRREGLMDWRVWSVSYVMMIRFLLIQLRQPGDGGLFFTQNGGWVKVIGKNRKEFGRDHPFTDGDRENE